MLQVTVMQMKLKKCMKLAPDEPKFYGTIETGKMLVEGKKLYDSDSNFIKDRRKFSFEGIILVSVIINQDFTLNKDIKISFNGLPDHQYEHLVDIFKEIFVKEYLSMNNEKKSSDLIVGDLIKKIIRGIIREDSNKKPEVNSHIMRI